MPERYAKKVYGSLWWVPWWGFEIALWLMIAGAFLLGLYPIMLVLLYGAFVEPRLITVKRFDVGNGKRSVTIAFLSDLHAGPYKREGWFRRLTERTNALGADIILLGGDYLLESPTDAERLTPLAGLKAPLGVFGMLGNHDDYFGRDAVVQKFSEMKIPLLINAGKRLRDKGLAVAAVDDDWYSDARFDQALSDVGENDAYILLSHNPEAAVNGLKEMRKKPALILSGHDHGGQIRLPFIGSVPRMPHRLGRRFDRGQFDIEGSTLIIGQGVGESGPRARLLCPPQIVFVTLHY